VIRIDMIGQAATEVQRDAAVPKAGWLTHEQHPAHEFGVPVGNLQQLISGHAGGRGHAENVGRLGRHRKQ